jgi:hypothetical protein
VDPLVSLNTLTDHIPSPFENIIAIWQNFLTNTAALAWSK